MPFKIFLVEDEIVTREGIRETVDWQGAGFELCGDAPDGEMALPLIQATSPDVLITDIRMPFMDGLQLCRIVRERWPAMKTIILSGHNEFEYAQQAIEAGVTEYLLKPLGARDLEGVLRRLASQLDREREEAERLRALHRQVEEHRALLLERLLMKLLVGAVAPAEALAQSLALEVELAARCYLVTVVRVEPEGGGDGAVQAVQQVQGRLAELAAINPDLFLLNKDLDESVLLMKGHVAATIQEERDLLLDQAGREAQRVSCRLLVGHGPPAARLADLSTSFAGALAGVQQAGQRRDAPGTGPDRAELIKVDRSAVDEYLRCGAEQDFDAFFDAFVLPLGDAIGSYLVRNYVVVDMVLVAARLVEGLGGDPAQILPGADNIEATVSRLGDIEAVREYARSLLGAALAYRDGQAGRYHGAMIRQARRYIETHYTDPELSLSEVAAHVNHSAGHFSAVFGQETGVTFKQFLTDLRIRRARELLRTTAARSSEIAAQVGYADPHYFSFVFHRETGLTPTAFRAQTPADPEPGGEIA